MFKLCWIHDIVLVFIVWISTAKQCHSCLILYLLLLFWSEIYVLTYADEYYIESKACKGTCRGIKVVCLWCIWGCHALCKMSVIICSSDSCIEYTAILKFFSLYTTSACKKGYALFLYGKVKDGVRMRSVRKFYWNNCKWMG